ncbi:hypothetical protein FACS189421_05250 [Bacteroidia bacterium]|nr:hypothetical protein FACS189421_05250 [Bacteroidia bacterium]GHT46759.1 hypothetical protein FACS189440_05500 [Bacteroidia bacterium]
MRFNPKDFIKISKELKAGYTEAHYRTLINRAYYGAFGYIRERLPIYTDGISVHREVIRFLENSPNRNENEIGRKLKILFNKRIEADYKYHIEVKNFLCEYVIFEAEKIIVLFDKKDYF